MTCESPDQRAAHDFLSELRTRIATQPLPYQHGVEERALESLWELFSLARKAMRDNPGCERFARSAARMLNVELRPITAKWHRASEAGLLRSRDGANEFRADLMALRGTLSEYCLDLQEMAYGTREPDETPPPVLDADEVERCFEPVRFGLGVDAATAIPNAGDIDRSEAEEIAARREALGIATAHGTDAVGLALSGGGIRSATFCLGVVQVLSQRGLLGDFDYLSTVSGGGYTGGFMTSRIGRGQGFEQVGRPFGPDTEAIRHLRRNAKYLSAVDWKQRWLMATGTVAGLMLNLTAPLCVLAALALAANALAAHLRPEAWLVAAAALAALTSVAMLGYGASLRLGVGARSGGALLAGGAGLTLVALAAAAVERGYVLFNDVWLAHWPAGAALSSVITAPAAVRFLPLFRTMTGRRAAFRIVLLLAGALVPVIGTLGYYALRILGSARHDAGAPLWDPHRYADGWLVLLLVLATAGAFAVLVLDINLTGPHKLYRDQLAKTFIRHSPSDAIPALDTVNASRLAPYHLINATINLPSSTSEVLRDRRGDFFLLSKAWCGSPAVGYRPTSSWRVDGARTVDVATAMAISGAAASPHMGLESVPTLSALMTLLNIRLGFWMARPGRRMQTSPGFSCLLREMTGTFMSERSDWFNLSDGGHIENMGVYELLRRRCKFIVCVDGEADPASTFAGQLTLVRHAQIDFGIRIEPKFDDIRPDPTSRFSRTHLQLFRIRYPEEPARPSAIGLMLYLKLSLTGNEAEMLKRYHALHPEFPHQSTLDQFYDEEQFEAYRQLGVHVAEGAFSSALMTEDRRPSTVPRWFRQLAANMLEPSGDG